MKQPYNLVGQDGNAFSLIGYTVSAMRDAYRFGTGDTDNITKTNWFEKLFNRDAQRAFQEKAMSSDYNNLIVVCDTMIHLINESMGLSVRESDDCCGNCDICGICSEEDE